MEPQQTSGVEGSLSPYRGIHAIPYRPVGRGAIEPQQPSGRWTFETPYRPLLGVNVIYISYRPPRKAERDYCISLRISGK